MTQDTSEVSIDDEIAERMASGAPREALQLLLRAVPERGLRAVAPTPLLPRARCHYLRLAACFAMLGMEPDALDWCAEAEKAGRAEPDNGFARRLRTLRLWLMVDARRVSAVVETAANLLRCSGLEDELRAAVIASLIITATRTGDFVSGRNLVAASTPLQHQGGLGNALLQISIAEMEFREVLLELPHFEGSLAKRMPPGVAAVLDKEAMALRISACAERFKCIVAGACQWPLLADIARASQTAAQLLGEQLRGKQPSLGALESHLAGLSARGLTPFLRHARFLLAVLALQNGKSATAEAWLTNAQPIKQFMDKADPDELHLLACARAESRDFCNAYRIYRAYVRLASEQAMQCLAMRAILLEPARDATASERPGKTQRFAHDAAFASRRLLAKDASLDRADVNDPIESMLERTTAAVRGMVEHDLSRPLLVSDIVAALGVSRRTLEVRVRRSSGTSVKRYVASIRLQHARHLILAQGTLTTDSLKRIALQVGFPTYRTFNAAYRQSFGAAPIRRHAKTNEFEVT